MPDSQVYLGHVPFDSSYRHTVWFASREDQTQQMLSHMNSAFSDNDYTFIREGATIRVPVNADQLNGYNYCMFSNGGKWYYNFITRIVYVNEGTTELYLRRDVIQTWMFDFDRTACFVEREHVSDDTRYAHTVAEPPMDMEYTYANYNETVYGQDYVVVQTTTFPHYRSTDISDPESLVSDGGDSCTGGNYNGLYSSSKNIVYKTTTAQNNPNFSPNMDFFIRDMNNFNSSGCADAISNIYTVPYEFMGNIEYLKVRDIAESSAITYNTRYQQQESTDARYYDGVVSQAGDFGGYTPRNNKLYCYPYSYVEFGDFTGRKNDAMFENANARDGGVWYRIMAGVCGEMVGTIRLKDYEGCPLYASSMTIDLGNKLPWTYDTYANWSSQNQMANALSVIGSVVGGALTVAPGISGAVAGLGLGTAQHLATPRHMSAADIMRGSFTDEVSPQGAVGSALALGGTIANIDRMKRQPNEARGNLNGNARVTSDTYGYYTANRQLKPEFARVIDDFFTMFGYEVDVVKVPEFTSRPSFNYIKTRNCPWNGNVNSQDMSAINAIFDNGITLWHTWDVGNYSLGNGV